MSRFPKVTGGRKAMRGQRILIALGGALVLTFLVAGLLGTSRPGTLADPLEAGGAQLLRTLIWCALGASVALVVKWVMQQRK